MQITKTEGFPGRLVSIASWAEMRLLSEVMAVTLRRGEGGDLPKLAESAGSRSSSSHAVVSVSVAPAKDGRLWWHRGSWCMLACLAEVGGEALVTTVLKTGKIRTFPGVNEGLAR